MMESGIVLAVAVAAVVYLLIAAKEDLALVLTAIYLGALLLRRNQQWIDWK